MAILRNVGREMSHLYRKAFAGRGVTAPCRTLRDRCIGKRPAIQIALLVSQHKSRGNRERVDARGNRERIRGGGDARNYQQLERPARGKQQAELEGALDSDIFAHWERESDRGVFWFTVLKMKLKPPRRTPVYLPNTQTTRPKNAGMHPCV